MNPIRTAPPSRSALWLLILAVVSCGRDPAASRPIRLIDRTTGARIDSSIDLSQARDLSIADAREIRDGTLTAMPTSVEHRGTWIAGAVFDLAGRDPEPLHLRATRMELAGKGGPVAFELDVGRTLTPDERAFVLLRRAPVEADALADPEQLGALLRQNRPFLTRLEPDPARPGAYARLVDADDMRSALFCVVGHEDTMGEARLTVRQLSEKGAWLREPSLTESPWTRSVTAGDVTSEAWVVGVPGGVRVQVDVPESAPRLRAYVTTMFAPNSGFRVTATARSGEEELRQELGLRHPADTRRWREIELDLEPFAGRQAVDLELHCDAVRGVPPGAALCAFATPVIETAGVDARPDVIVISLDTLRADRVSPYGAPEINTPHITRLAASAALFERAVAAAPWTLPAHATMMTGLYPDRHGAHAPTSRIPDAARLLAEDFRAAGYETIAFTGGGYVNPAFGFARGFERYGINDPAYPPPGWVEARGGGASAQAMAQSVRNARAELLRRVEEERGRPLFLFVHTYAAHNYAAPPDVLKAMGATDAQVPELLRELVPGDVTSQWTQAKEAGRVDEHARWRTRFLYDASVRVADDLVGAIVAALEQTGRLERAIIIVTSDHGEELLERDNIGHGHSLFEEQIHVPLIVRTPGRGAQRIADPVSIADLAPTIRELCGLEEVAGDGRSLLPLLDGDDLAPRTPLSRGNRRDIVMRSLRGRDTKYITRDDPSGGRARMLFDLRDDPGEIEDLAERRADEVERIDATLLQWVEELKQRRVGSDGAALSQGVVEQLRQLGYLGDG